MNMKKCISVLLLISALFSFKSSTGNKEFRPYEKWKDTAGNIINAHGGGILFDKGKYYWFGEIKKGKTWLVPKQTWECYRVNAGGISCYSSENLYDWKYEGIALSPNTIDSTSDIHISKVLERPKAIYNAKTGKYVMWLHIDCEDYSCARAGVAISDKPEGPYTYLGSMRPNEQMSRDMTLFRDDDGKGYQIYSSENNATMHISLLTDDYLKPSGTEKRIFIDKSREAPAMFKHNGKYFLITSACTGWSPNAAMLASADAVLGEWKELYNPCRGPHADSTYFSQSTYVLPVAGKSGNFIFMADRWNKTNLEESRYVWLPLFFRNDSAVIEWKDSWELNTFRSLDNINVSYTLAGSELMDLSEKILYKHTPQEDMYLYLLRPEGKTKHALPAIVYFTGGGWVNGGVEFQIPNAAWFRDHGIIGITADYRVKSRHGTTPLECIEDAKSAIRYVRAHASELGVDPGKIIAAGGSAGGHIAACTVIDGGDAPGEDTKISSKPNALVLHNPVLGEGFGMDFFKAHPEFSPITHIKPGWPPVILSNGTKDNTTPFESAEKFTRLMKEAGNVCELIAVKDADHSCDWPVSNPNFLPTLQRMTDFLKEQKIINSQVKYRDGIFAGSSQSLYADEPYWGIVKLKIRDNSISDISFTIRDSSLHETFNEKYEKHFEGNQNYVQQCRNDWNGVKTYPEKLHRTQDPDKVDVVSGATWSYNIFKASLKEALKDAIQ
jgi:acetyl esterase/lipase